MLRTTAVALACHCDSCFVSVVTMSNHLGHQQQYVTTINSNNISHITFMAANANNIATTTMLGH